MIDNISKLREVQLELLHAFSTVCAEHKLKWYAFFGTLLGIQRGEGFLPWDDDVDVAMPMEDYRTLCAHRTWFDEGLFFLQTPMDPGGLRFAKLRLNGTTAFREDLVTELRAGGHHGIAIDIIPLAELPGMGAYHTPSILSPGKKEAVYLKEWFEPSGTGRFEDMELRTPAKPGRILSECYGDWAWPMGARESHPSYWFFDTEKGYEIYVRRYTGMLDDIDGKRILLFGAADSQRIWLERFGRREQVICTFDNDSKKWGKLSHGVSVRDPKELPVIMNENSRIIIVSLWHQEIGRQLERMGINDYYVYLDEYYDEGIGKKVVRREDLNTGDAAFPKWKG